MEYVEQAAQLCLMQHVQYQLLCGGRPVFTSQVHVLHVSSQPTYEVCIWAQIEPSMDLNVLLVLHGIGCLTIG